MRKKLFKKPFSKLALTIGTLSIVTSAPLTAIACSSDSNAASENTKFQIQRGDVVTSALNYYYGIVLNDQFKDQKNTTEMIDNQLKTYLEWYSKYQFSNDVSYWTTQYGEWINASDPYLSNNPGEDNYLDPNEFDVSSFLSGKDYFGSPATIDNDFKVVKSFLPKLYLSLQQMLVIDKYFHASTESIQKYFNNKNQSNSIDKSYSYDGSTNYWLTKYVQENKPNIGWRITYPSTDTPADVNNTNDWNNAQLTQAEKAKKSPFLNVDGKSSSLNTLVNSVDGQKYFSGAGVLGANPSDFNLDEMGGFLGLQKDYGDYTTSDDVKRANGFSFGDADLEAFFDNKSDPYKGANRFGFVTDDSNSADGDAIHNQSVATDGSGWSSAVSVNGKFTRSIVIELYNAAKSTQDTSDPDSQPYFEYQLSGIMKDPNFQKELIFLISQDGSMIDTAREYFYNLGYKLEVYVKAIRDKLESTPNLLDNE